MLDSSPVVDSALETPRTPGWFETHKSLWQATAIEPPTLAPLDSSTQADVVVIGGGYLGLSCALRLAERGADVVLLDAVAPGFGASGRNGGQVIPGLKYDPDELIAMYGAQAAEPIIDFAAHAPDRVFAIVERHAIDCDPVREGWIQGAHSSAMLRAVEARAKQWRVRGADVELLAPEELTRRIGCAPGLYCGGWLDRRAGSVQPLSFARGLAKAAQRHGARLYAPARATGIGRTGQRWSVTIDGADGGAQVHASHVVIATNAYSDGLWPRLRSTVIPAQSFQVATDPLPDTLRDTILRNREVVSDARRLLHYYRLDAAGRLVIGGRGTMSSPTRDSDFEHIRRALAKTFPVLAGVHLPYFWSGRLAMTQDSLPHLHQPVPGVTIALGCNGRGLALTTAVGERIAEHLLDDARHPLPFPTSPLKPIPLHGLHRGYVTALIQYYKLLDLF